MQHHSRKPRGNQSKTKKIRSVPAQATGDAPMHALLSQESVLQWQQLVGNAQVQRMLKAGSAVIMRDAGTKPPPIDKELKEAEKRFEELLKAQAGKSPKKSDSVAKAVEKTATAFTKTKVGKRLLDLALSKEGLPATITVYAGALVYLETSGKEPFIPPIPLGDNFTLNVEWKGTFSDPKSVKLLLTFKPKSGGGDKLSEKKTEKPAPGLTDEGWDFLQKNHDLIEKWIVKCAFDDYEVAGPDEEENKKKYYQHVRDSGVWPDATALGSHMASKIREANAAGAKHAYIELLPHDEWKELKNRLPNAYFGAMEHLKTIVEHVVKDLGSELGSVNQVVFKTHDGKLFPMSVSPSK